MAKSKMSTKLAGMYVLLTTAIILIGVVSFYRYGYKSAYQEGISNITQIAETVMGQIDSRLTTMDSVAVDVLTDAAFMEIWEEEAGTSSPQNTEEIRRILTKYYVNRSDIRRVSVYTKTGKYFSTGITEVTKKQVRDRVAMIQEKYIMNQLNSRAFVSMNYDFWNPGSNSSVFSLIKPIKDRDTNIIGYIEVQQNAFYIENICDVVWSKHQLDVVVFMENSEEAFYAKLNDTEDVNEKVAYLADVARQYARVREVGKELVFTASSNYYAGKVVLVLQQSMLTEAFDKSMKALLFMALILMLGTVLFCIVIVKVIMHPINSLTSHMANIDIDNLNEKLDIKVTDRETEVLINSFERMAERLQESLTTQKKLESVQTKTLFNALQSEMGPHFLYNSLGSIANMCEQGETEMAGDACYSLTEILRYASNYETSEVTIGEEIENLSAYMAIMKSRYRQRLDFEMVVDENAKHMIVPKLTFQPIVENAIKYSLIEHEHVIIKVFVVVIGDELLIEVKDNGCGISKEAGDKIKSRIEEFLGEEDVSEIASQIQFGGLGLSGTLIRLSIFYGEGFWYQLQEKNDAGGTSILLGMNIKNFR